MREVVRMMRPTLPADIEMRQEIELDLARVEAMPSELFQVMINLCANAAHAVGDAGVITLHVSTVRRVSDTVRLGRGTHESWVCIEVADDGPGMDEETLRRVREPGFTTRAQDGGRGLGLAIVQRVVKDLEGELEIDTAPGEGARVRALLPALEEASFDALSMDASAVS